MKLLLKSALLAASALLLTIATPQNCAAQNLDPDKILHPTPDSWPLYHGDYSGRRHSALNFVAAYVCRRKLDPERMGHRLNCPELAKTRWPSGVANHYSTGHEGRDLLEQLHPFPAHDEFETREAGGIAAGPRQTLHKAGSDRVGDVHEHNWDGASCLLQQREVYTAICNDHIRLRRN